MLKICFHLLAWTLYTLLNTWLTGKHLVLSNCLWIIGRVPAFTWGFVSVQDTPHFVGQYFIDIIIAVRVSSWHESYHIWVGHTSSTKATSRGCGNLQQSARSQVLDWLSGCWAEWCNNGGLFPAVSSISITSRQSKQKRLSGQFLCCCLHSAWLPGNQTSTRLLELCARFLQGIFLITDF